MSYFDNFPTLLYTFDNNLVEFKQVVNIFVRLKFLDSIINNVALFDQYDIKDGDTPWGIAYKLYSDPMKYWIVLYANIYLDPYYQWPLTVDQFNQNMTDQFGGIANAQGTLHHIEKHTNMITTINYQQTINTYVSIISANVVSVDGSTDLPTIEHPLIQVGSNNVVTFNDNGAISTVDTSVQLLAVSNYDYCNNQNEANRTIKLIDPTYVPQIEAEFLALLGQ